MLGSFSPAMAGEGHKSLNKLVSLPLRVHCGPHQESQNANLGSLEDARPCLMGRTSPGTRGRERDSLTEEKGPLKSKAKATVTTRYGVGVKAGHYNPSDQE